MDKIMEEKLAKANDLREKEQFGESIKLYTDCLTDLISLRDWEGMVHSFGGTSYIYKILAGQKNNKHCKSLCAAFALEAYTVGQEHQNEISKQALSISHSVYGDSLILLGKNAEALEIFQKAYDVSPAELPEKGRLKAHIGGIHYQLGDKTNGIKLIEEALADIRTGDLSAYHIRVWETGCLNKLAIAASWDGNQEKALQIANESLQISLEHKLSIRQKEVEEIISKINKGETDFSL